ncbi:hypothetical protein C8J57DRAFT_1247222 [Mycena rebaudengoi]|nr:hypothetical protein C8J57DRAFT_1247222 [Mycena rebaudengoi]
MELCCLKGGMEPMPADEPGQPFAMRVKVIKYGSVSSVHGHALTQLGVPSTAIFTINCFLVQAATVMRYTRDVFVKILQMKTVPNSWMDRREDTCRQGCLDANGFPIKKFGAPKRSSQRRCAAGCLDSAGKRAIKYGEQCSRLDPRRNAGMLLSFRMHLYRAILCTPSQLPTSDKRVKNAQAKRIARGLDREFQILIPSLDSLPRDEYAWMPIETRKSREKTEKSTRDHSWATRYAVGRANVLNYVEPVFVYQFELSFEIRAFKHARNFYRKQRKFLNRYTQVGRPDCNELRCGPVYKLESGPFNPPPVCGEIINLRKISDKIALRSSMALMETEFREVFNETICLHIREHMNRFGPDFNSNACILMPIPRAQLLIATQGIGLSRNNCRDLVLYVPPLFP